jgi:hypothetical protein
LHYWWWWGLDIWPISWLNFLILAYLCIRYRFTRVIFQTKILQMHVKMKTQKVILNHILSMCESESFFWNYRFFQECPTTKRKQSCCILRSIYFLMNWAILSCIPCYIIYYNGKEKNDRIPCGLNKNNFAFYLINGKISTYYKIVFQTLAILTNDLESKHFSDFFNEVSNKS